MIDITSEVENFRTVLKKGLSIMLESKFDMGSEKWDEYSEILFDVLIIDNLNVKYQKELTSSYGYANQDSEVMILFEATNDTLVGKHIDEHTVKYDSYNGSGNEKIQMTFVQFSNPSLYDDNLENMDYVLGIDSQGILYCTKVDNCTFYIND